MNFTYYDYAGLIELLKEKGYTFCDYHDYKEIPRCVILRHDIDQSPAAALKMAEIEAEHGVKSTYFLLLRTDFYNPASKTVQEQVRRIRALGHEIGLHFDEMAYEEDLGTIDEKIQREAEILSAICGDSIRCVSMHRPSKRTLEANIEIPGIVNSYGKTFFRDFKYLSDSRRNWREPVLNIVRSGEYDRLHILTHAFWYHEDNIDMVKTIENYIEEAKIQRYDCFAENISDIQTLGLPLKK